MLPRDANIYCLEGPTAHLDAVGKRRVFKILKASSRYNFILVHTYGAKLKSFADRIMDSEQGRIPRKAASVPTPDEYRSLG